MKRKVNRVGTNTLTVSLPSRWVAQQGIKAGDELNLVEERKVLILSKETKHSSEKQITLDITHFSKHMLYRYLEVIYIANYQSITLTYSNAEILSDKEDKMININTLIKTLSHRFIGMEIISQTQNKTVLRCFLLNEEKEVEQIEKRIFFIIKDTFDEFLSSLKDRHQEFHTNIYDHHDNISKFITYFLRVLDQSDKSEEEKKHLYSLYLIIDKMMDKFRHVSEMIYQHGCTERVERMLKEIFELFYEQFLVLHKGEIKKELVSKRYNLVKKVEKTDWTLKELRVIAEVKIFLDTINDFSRAVIVKGLES